MLTIEQCRQLLGDEKITTEEIQSLLNAIHRVNVQVLDEYFADEYLDDDVD